MSDTSVPMLPGELHVLRHVDLQQRLGSCSLVCRAWRAAAAAVTTEVAVTGCGAYGPASILQRVDSVGQWLCSHAAAVDQLTVQIANTACFTTGAPLLKLPLTQLRQLQLLSLAGCTVQAQVGDSSSSGGSRIMLCEQLPQQQQQQQHLRPDVCR